MKQAIKVAFPYTIPIMIGYVFLGFAFGVLLEQAGFGVLWAILMSTFIFSGALQFVCISFLSGGTNLIVVLFISFVMNFRHFFYGISMLDTYKGLGKKKSYLIFALTDETFSLLNTIEAPENVDRGWFYFFISLFHQSYWVIGSILGSVCSNLLFFDSTGIDFAMTALFVVLFIEQLRSTKQYVVGMLGIVLSFLSLLVAGKAYFIILSLLLIVLSLMYLRKRGTEYES